jgi:hypothetical protein
MTLVPLSRAGAWHLASADQDVRGFAALRPDGQPSGRTVADLLLDTEAERVEALLLDDGSQVPASDVSLVDGVVYLAPPSPPVAGGGGRVDGHGARAARDAEADLPPREGAGYPLEDVRAALRASYLRAQRGVGLQGGAPRDGVR